MTDTLKLDVELARELAFEPVGSEVDGFTVVANEDLDQGRWEQHKQLIIRNASGQHYAGGYSVGLTEMQDTGPWEYEDTAEFTPVVVRQRVVTVTEYVAEEAA